MKSLFLVVLTVACGSAELEPGLREYYTRTPEVDFNVSGKIGEPSKVTGDCRSIIVTFGVGKRPGVDYFFDVPRTIARAIISRWSSTPRPAGHLPSLYLYCHHELTVCVFFDDTGNAAGLQIALDQSNYTDYVFDTKVTGLKEWVVTTKSGQVRKFWTTAVYFVSEDYLRLPASERETNRNSSKFLQEDAVWTTGFNGVVDKISVEESEIQKTIFKRQGCFPGMGRHYFYNMTKDAECRGDTLYPYFLTTDSNKLMAVGLSITGKYKLGPGRRAFIEPPPKAGKTRETILPGAPKCFLNLGDDPGMILMHVYFIDKPWKIVCPINK